MKSGIVIINKEKGDTSQKVVSKLKKKLNIKKAGHTGTLDPLATGVLPVLLGDATKFSKYLIEHDKTYIAELKLGIKRDTGDNEGNIIEERKVPNITETDILKVFKQIKGKQKQAPHKYSAVKINGKKLYEYARDGIKIEIPKREIEIYSINLLNFDKENNIIKYEVECSKGTYIRVLCEDIAEKLNTVGYMNALQRIKTDKFTIEKSVKIEDVSDSDIISCDMICEKLEKIELNSRKLELFLNGVMLTIDKNDGIYKIFNDSKFIGTGIVKNNLLKRDVVIN